MSTVQNSEGFTYSLPVVYPDPDATVPSRVVTQTTVLDANDGDGTHLLLKGTIANGDEYVRCETAAGGELFAVKHDGMVVCSDLQTSTISSLNTDFTFLVDAMADLEGVEQETAKIEDADAVRRDHVDNSLVKRGTGTNYCEINRLQSEQFRVLGSQPNIALYGNGAINFVPLDSSDNPIANCEYSFGKKLQNFGDPTQAGDGLYIKNDDNEIQIECRKGAPTIRITGEKDNGIDYLQIIDENDIVLYSIDKTGKVRPPHHLIDTALSSVADLEAHSGVFEAASIYVGPVRISYDKTTGDLKQQVLNRIPTTLQSAPYNISSADLGGRSYGDLSARQWIVLARQKSGDNSVQARDIFTNAADWSSHNVHHAKNLTSDAQVQLDDIKTDVADLETLTTNMNTDVTTAESNITTLQTDMNAVEDSLSILANAAICYVDVSRTESYTEDGSPTKPFKTLQDAMAAKITEGATQTIEFRLAAGTYNVAGGLDFQMSSSSQSFAIVGTEDRSAVNIRCTDITTDVLYARNFKTLVFRNVTFHTGKYGL